MLCLNVFSILQGDRGDESHLANTRLHVLMSRNHQCQGERGAQNLFHPHGDDQVTFARECNAISRPAQQSQLIKSGRMPETLVNNLPLSCRCIRSWMYVKRSHSPSFSQAGFAHRVQEVFCKKTKYSQKNVLMY